MNLKTHSRFALVAKLPATSGTRQMRPNQYLCKNIRFKTIFKIDTMNTAVSVMRPASAPKSLYQFLRQRRCLSQPALLDWADLKNSFGVTTHHSSVSISSNRPLLKYWQINSIAAGWRAEV